MKYYFYDGQGNVNLAWNTTPPQEMLELPHLASDMEFEQREGYYISLKVVKGELIPTYNEINIEEDEIELIKQQIQSLNIAIAEMMGMEV